MKEKYCEECDIRYFDNKSFCPACGTELVDRKQCVFKRVETDPSRCPDCNQDTLRFGKADGRKIMVCENLCDVEYEPNYIRRSIYLV